MAPPARHTSPVRWGEPPPGLVPRAVARVRRLCGTRRVGHAGTLDPMATGVLVLGVEKGTMLLTFLVGCDKGYRATIRLGQATVTDDAGLLRSRFIDNIVPRTSSDSPSAISGKTG